MFCPNCGKKNEEESIFCLYCGTRLGVEKFARVAEKPIEKGFFASLFDFSLKEFITLKILRRIYAAAVVVNVLIGIGIIIFGLASAFSEEGKFWVFILSLLFAPLIFLLLTVLDRISVEVLAVAFRIAENTKIIAENTKK